jgi:hypothetical protein
VTSCCFVFFCGVGGGGGGGVRLGYVIVRDGKVLRQRLCTELYIVVRVTKTSDCDSVVHERWCFCWGGAPSWLYAS